MSNLEIQDPLNANPNPSSYTPIPIPDEILVEILLHTIHSHPPYLPPTSIDPSAVLTTNQFTSYTPWTIRQICYQWRNVVLNTPMLWKHIWIIIQPELEQSDYPLDRERDEEGNTQPAKPTVQKWKPERHIKLAQALLPQTGDVGLHIWKPDGPLLYLPGMGFEEPDNTLIQQLIPLYGKRISDLTLIISSDAALELCKFDATLFSSIETLYLEFLAGRVSHAELFFSWDTSNPFLQTKALKNLGVAYNTYQVSSPAHLICRCDVQWLQIRELSLTCDMHSSRHYLADIVKVLKNCHQLSHFRIASPLATTPPLSGFGSVSLPKLQTLILHSNVSLLHILSAPLLHTLKIHSECNYARSGVLTFLHRSAPPIAVYSDQDELGPKESPKASYNEQIHSICDLAAALPVVQELRVGLPFDGQHISDFVQGKIFPMVTSLHCYVGMVSKPTDLFSIFEQASQEHTAFRYRTVRAFTHSLGQFSGADAFMFDAHADELRRKTGIVLEHIHGQLDISSYHRSFRDRHAVRYLP